MMSSETTPDSAAAKPVAALASALLAGLLAGLVDVAAELYLQGTEPDEAAMALLPWAVTVGLTAAATAILAAALALLPWPRLSWAEAAAVAAFNVVGATALTAVIASRDFGSGWLSTRVVLAVGAAVAAGMLAATLLGLRGGQRNRFARWLSPETLLLLSAPVAVLAGLQLLPTAGLALVVVAGVLAALAAVRGLRTRGTSLTLVAGTLLAASFTGSLFLGPGRAAPPAETPTGPRLVLLLTIDTLRADYGGLEASDVPNLTALARGGVTFDHAVSSTGWTVPAFASILTGLPPEAHQTGAAKETLPAAFPTLAEQLRDAGYRTVALGKNPFLRPYRGLDRGFDRYTFYPRNVLETSIGSRLLRRNQGENPLADIDTDGLADAGIALLREAVEEPTFLWLHFFDPHIPYAPPERFVEDKLVREITGGAFDGLGGVRAGHRAPDADERYAILELYKAEIRWVDEAVGRVLEELELLGLADDTLLVMTSDHGEEFWEHGGFEHGHTLYEELVHVPLAIRGPGVPAGARVARRVATASVFATVRELAGVTGDLPFAVSPSLVSGFGEPEGDSETPKAETDPALAFSSGTRYYDQLASVQFGPYKLITNLSFGSEELYDLVSDPQEQSPLVGEDAAEALARGRELLEAQQEAGGAIAEAVGGDGEDRELDAQTLRRLRSLGYVQ